MSSCGGIRWVAVALSGVAAVDDELFGVCVGDGARLYRVVY